MRNQLSTGIVLFAGLLATPVMTHPVQHVTGSVSYENDPRYLRLKSYLNGRTSPLEELSADFLAAADRNELDWRLLPAIAVLESGGGKRYMNNNVFGWDSCRVRFSSIRTGIHYVADRLANSKLYRDKDTEGILRTYNPYSFYPPRIKRIMRALGPDDPEGNPIPN